MVDRDPEDALDRRREFVRHLRAHDVVHQVDFSRDGYQVIQVQLEPGVEFREAWRETATELGYSIESGEVTTTGSDRGDNTWRLELDDP
jgi:hypothetical protein